MLINVTRCKGTGTIHLSQVTQDHTLCGKSKHLADKLLAGTWEQVLIGKRLREGLKRASCVTCKIAGTNYLANQPQTGGSP